MKQRTRIIAGGAGLLVVLASGVAEAVVASGQRTTSGRHLVEHPAPASASSPTNGGEGLAKSPGVRQTGDGATTTSVPAKSSIVPAKASIVPAKATIVPANTTTTPGSPSSGSSPPPPRAVPHVMVIVMENASYGDIIGNSSVPYFNSLAQNYVSVTQSYAVAHPSLPNYLEMTSASTWGVTDDGSPGGDSGGAPNLMTEMDAAGLSWAGYMENMPSIGYTGGDTGGDDGYGNQLYQQHHNPFVYYPSLAGELGNDKPLSYMIGDLNSANPPDFVFVTPNMLDDWHDGPLATGDNWLAQEVPTIQATKWYKAGATIIVTTDEGNSSDGSGIAGGNGGHVPTVVVSQALHGHGAHNAPVDQAGIVGSLDQLWGLSMINDAATSGHGSLGNLLVGG
jgi:hypothetical protein